VVNGGFGEVEKNEEDSEGDEKDVIDKLPNLKRRKRCQKPHNRAAEQKYGTDEKQNFVGAVRSCEDVFDPLAILDKRLAFRVPRSLRLGIDRRGIV